MNTNRIIRIAKCYANSFNYNVNVSVCGNSSAWSEMTDMAQSATPNTIAQIDTNQVIEAFENNGIRSAIAEVISQMLYASPDMDLFQSDNYSIEVSVK
jgi:hypothetical protein